MEKTSLKTVTRTQGNNAAIKDGSIVPKRYQFEFEEVPILVHAFRRMVRNLEYDVCEMAITTYLCAKEHGKLFTALPIFLVRGFHQEAILYNTNSQIRSPKDLEGKQVGVNRGYTVTTGVWARGILQESYGVDLSKVTWVLSGDEHVEEYRAPSNVVSMPSGTTLEEMLVNGEIAAAIGIESDDPNLQPLIENPTEAGFKALRESGLYPINHLVVVKDELLSKHADLARDVFDAFAEAKRLYVGKLRNNEIADLNKTDKMYKRVMEITGEDPLPYGIEPNRMNVEKLIEFALNQSIITRRPSFDEIFDKSVLSVSG